MNLYIFSVVFCLAFSFSSVLCDLMEGADCVSEGEGLAGTCADIRKCMQYVKILKEKNRPQICSYKNMVPIVCCTDCELVNDTRDVIVNRYGLHYFKTGSKAHDKCLEYVYDHPYPCHTWGGVHRYLDDDEECYVYSLTAILAAATKKDPTSSHPHMALLGYGHDEKKAQWLCAGTLISHRYVLTAAHCIYFISAGPVQYIALGLVNSAYQWEKYTVQKALTHPEYKSTFKYFDIGLAESDTWIKFTHTVSPACLNTGEVTEDVAFATGWSGKLHRRGRSESLTTVILTPYDESECFLYHPDQSQLIYGYNHTTQMCYGDQKHNNDICQLDMGGPLTVQSELSSCTHTVVGVTSHGEPCRGSAVYTRVSYFVPWIESIVWP